MVEKLHKVLQSHTEIKCGFPNLKKVHISSENSIQLKH